MEQIVYQKVHLELLELLLCYDTFHANSFLFHSVSFLIRLVEI